VSDTAWPLPPARPPLPPAGGRLLVATPLLGDPNFVRTVVYLLEHDDNGTVGVVVNRPSRTPVGQVLPAWQDVVCGPAVVFGGGPVQPDGALCLGRISDRAGGRLERGTASIRPVVDGVCTVDLDGDAAGVASGTDRLRVFAGHSGWSPGQLAEEIGQGGWWVVPGDSEDLFSADPRPLWTRVLRRQPPPLSLVSTFPADPLAN
jgi:putative transcriptional regulator